MLYHPVPDVSVKRNDAVLRKFRLEENIYLASFFAYHNLLAPTSIWTRLYLQ